jgi:hypothetical protein
LLQALVFDYNNPDIILLSHSNIQFSNKKNKKNNLYKNYMSLIVFSGNAQTTTINTAFSNPLIIRAINQTGSGPVEGVAVLFESPNTGASCQFSNNTTSITATTNINGSASSGTITANGTAGPYNVVVSAIGFSDSVFNLSNLPVPCVAFDTQILMADGTVKPIQKIERGDLVAGDLLGTLHYRVARVTNHIITDDCPNDIVIFEKDSLGLNMPVRRLIIGANHALIWNHARRPAKCFSDLPDITRYYKKKIFKNDQSRDDVIYLLKDLLPPQPNDQYSLYDLQFETTGTYVAEGLVIQSRCPRSDLTPLPKDLYFDQSLYHSEVFVDNPDQILPLDLSQIKRNPIFESFDKDI